MRHDANLISIVFQTLGGAFLVSAGESMFVNTLIGQLKQNAPTIDPLHVITVGATGLRQAFTESELPGIVLSYMGALRITYCLAIASTGLATLIAVFSSWKSIKGKVNMGAD
jgi:hypothetical protein